MPYDERVFRASERAILEAFDYAKTFNEWPQPPFSVIALAFLTNRDPRTVKRALADLERKVCVRCIHGAWYDAR